MRVLEAEEGEALTMSETLPRWTPERDALLRERFPTSESNADVMAEINALPGETLVSPELIRVRAIALGVRRTPETIKSILSRKGREGAVKAKAMGVRQPPRAWTPDRVALLKQDFPRVDDLQDLLDRLNEMPGVPIGSIAAVKRKAQLLKITFRTQSPPVKVERRRPPVVGPLRVVPPEAVDHSAIMSVYDRACAAVRRAMKKGDLEWEETVRLANTFRMEPREIRMILGQVRCA